MQHHHQQVRFFGRKPIEPVEEIVYEPPPPRFAVVEHGDAYKKSLNGLHGQQIALAQLEGEGKDDPDYDPFLEEELEEIRLMREMEAANAEGEDTMDGDDTTAAEEEEEEEDEEGDLQHGESEEADENDTRALWRISRKIYNNDGSLKRNQSEIAILRAGAPAGGYFAIIALPGSQYKVTTDDQLIVNKLLPTSKWSVGSVHTLKDEDVLLLSSSSLTLVGMPYVPGGEVDVMVEEITQDAHVIVFKKRRRKNSKRKKGFRRDVSCLRILDIRFPEPYANHEHLLRPDPAPLVVNRKQPHAIIEYTSKMMADEE